MEASQSIPDLIATAQANAKTSEDRVSELLTQMEGLSGSPSQVSELDAATAALEMIAVDTFTMFEARMQHHFKRGPFSRKLHALLVASGETDLAQRVHQYYLAVNVLKHGTGASYRELLSTPNLKFSVRPAATADGGKSLVDVTGAGFFDGLSATVLEAYAFLESR